MSRLATDGHATSCAQCGAPVEEERRCYAIPTCYACLPPPRPLPTRPVRLPEPDEPFPLSARHRMPATLNWRAKYGEMLTIPNPAFAKLERLGKWTGGTPRELCYLHEEAGVLYLPRGCRPAPDEGVTRPVTRAAGVPELRPYQADAVLAAHLERQGLIVAPCGSGKTRMGLALIALSGQRALVLVHTLDLVRQWQEQASALALGDIEVRTVQGLPRDVAELDPYLAGFGCLVGDEIHRAPSRLFSQLVDRCPARYRYGLTATPDRADGLGRVLPWFFGRSFVVSAAELRAAGATMAATIEMRETGFRPESEEYADVIEELIRAKDRTQMIVLDVLRAWRAGHRCLVLSSRVAYAEQLAQRLDEQIEESSVELVHGESEDREGALARVRSGESQILVATTLADEGLDLPCLDRVFITLPSRSSGRAIQRLGRILRPSPGKTSAVLVDYVDDHGLLRSQARSRRLAYERALR